MPVFYLKLSDDCLPCIVPNTFKTLAHPEGQCTVMVNWSTMMLHIRSSRILILTRSSAVLTDVLGRFLAKTRSRRL